MAQKVGGYCFGYCEVGFKRFDSKLAVLSVPINTFISCQLSDKLMPLIPSSIALEKYRMCTFVCFFPSSYFVTLLFSRY